jgi:hypothetical protein
MWELEIVHSRRSHRSKYVFDRRLAQNLQAKMIDNCRPGRTVSESRRLMCLPLASDFSSEISRILPPSRHHFLSYRGRAAMKFVATSFIVIQRAHCEVLPCCIFVTGRRRQRVDDGAFEAVFLQLVRSGTPRRLGQATDGHDCGSTCARETGSLA